MLKFKKNNYGLTPKPFKRLNLVVHFPPNFQRPCNKTVCRMQIRFWGIRMVQTTSITVPSLVGVGHHTPPGGVKVWFFVSYWQHCTQRIALVFRLFMGRFWGFRPTGETLHRWGEIWCGGVQAKFHPISAGVGVAPKLTFLISAYKRPFGDFYQIFTVCGQLHGQSCIEIWTESLTEFQSYGVKV